MYFNRILLICSYIDIICVFYCLCQKSRLLPLQAPSLSLWYTVSPHHYDNSVIIVVHLLTMEFPLWRCSIVYFILCYLLLSLLHILNHSIHHYHYHHMTTTSSRHLLDNSSAPSLAGTDLWRWSFILYFSLSSFFTFIGREWIWSVSKSNKWGQLHNYMEGWYERVPSLR